MQELLIMLIVAAVCFLAGGVLGMNGEEGNMKDKCDNHVPVKLGAEWYVCQKR